MEKRIPILQMSSGEYVAEIAKILGKGQRHAQILYSTYMRTGKIEVPTSVEAQALSLWQDICNLTDFALPEISAERKEGETTKFLLKLHDGLETESVHIPMESGSTLCISSQIGCKMGCAFCETGKMGLIRNLTEKEIIAQVFAARHLLNCEFRKIVFMGMGEPFDNLDAVIPALRVLTDPMGLGFGPSRITVSTSGHVDGIYRFMQEVDPAVNLAVSINAPTDAIRRRIMPVNVRWDMDHLKKTLLEYCANPRREIFFEYVLLKGINDSAECADQLAEYLQDLRGKVNIIPYNPQSRDRFAPPDAEIVEQFLHRLRSHGIRALLRNPKGQGIMAACGQLGNLQLRTSRRHLQINGIAS